MSENLHEMLDRRESELAARASELRAELLPIEREIEEIKAARSAIVRVREIPARGSDAGKSAVAYWLSADRNAAYRTQTMKQLVRIALADHFKHGATANQMLSLFRDTFGRDDIIRSSLSPQLSRLKSEGEIMRDGLVWRLAPPKPPKLAIADDDRDFDAEHEPDDYEPVHEDYEE
jgi:hypothetical protein